MTLLMNQEIIFTGRKIRSRQMKVDFGIQSRVGRTARGANGIWSAHWMCIYLFVHHIICFAKLLKAKAVLYCS